MSGPIPAELEAILRTEADLPSPTAAIRDAQQTGEEPHAGAVVRQRVQLDGNPLPKGTVIFGPVTTTASAEPYMSNGAGWIEYVPPEDDPESVPVISGRYYDGDERFAIVAIMTVHPSETDLNDIAQW